MTTWLLEALIGAALLMVLVLAVRRPVARLWGAHMAYALWALPALRMMLSAIPGWQQLYVPVARANPAGDAALSQMSLADAAQFSQPLAVQAEQMGPLTDWPTLLIALWAAGAAVFLGVQWARHLRFVGKAVREGQLLTWQGGVDVIISARVAGPVAAGIIRRRILLPADFLKRYSPAERRLALLHEAAHHDRFDLVANIVGLVVLAAHWWNPVAHAAWRVFRADQELACDASVLAGSDGETRAAYGRAVLKSACVATPVAACAMNHKSQLKERIGMMKDRRITALSRVVGGLLLAGAAGAALAATASGKPPVPPVPPVSPVPPMAAELPVPPTAAELPVPPTAAQLPVPPAAPAAPRVMVFTHKTGGKDGKPGVHGEKIVRKIIIKDGKTLVDEASGEGPHVMMMHGGGPGETVRVMETPDGKKMVMIQRRELDGKQAEARIAEVKAGMRARCESDGGKLPANADFGQLAACGVEMQKKMQAVMASARAAVEKSQELSADQRAAALKGIDAAMTNTRREVIVKLEK
ncbi:M56 family metallopeptidase [Sandarakinorhabdus sp.]|uniref:M56 family metallopeptidase n=1 Tax=Sandarakinorhabdus sp. TaxID=1916663 RepID=UPI003566C9B3